MFNVGDLVQLRENAGSAFVGVSSREQMISGIVVKTVDIQKPISNFACKRSTQVVHVVWASTRKLETMHYSSYLDLVARNSGMANNSA